MKASVFVSMSDRKMALLIDAASQRIVVVMPAVRQEAAKALQSAVVRLGSDCVSIVMDCDEEVFRLGYGEIEAVKSLREAGCLVRQSSGLRIGLLVCDDLAWIFAPTALYVQAEIHSDETPNAVALAASEVERIVQGVMPAESTSDKVEIGHEVIHQRQFEQIQDALKQAPPVQFDIARQVRVFEPYLQYVELRLTGAAIQRHRVRIPKSIQNLGSTTDLEGRLRTTFDLIQKSGDLSSDRLESELNEIRNNFTRSLGRGRGRVMLKNQKPLLRQRLDILRQKLQDHHAKVAKKLQDQLDQSRKQVVDYYRPLAKANLPDSLVGQSLYVKPGEQEIHDWLEGELDRVFPRATDLVGKMTLEEQYKDVTFETLNHPDFLESLKKEFPQVNWEKAYKEFQAARERAAPNQC